MAQSAGTGDPSWDEWHQDKDTAALKPPKASDGWMVETRNITLRRRADGARQKLSRRVRMLARHGRVSQDQIEDLLGGLEDNSLESQNKLDPFGRGSARLC